MQFDYQGNTINIVGYDDKDWIYKSIVINQEFYELSLLEYMRYALKGCQGIMLDIGANIGNHAVYFGMFVSKYVVCFEPNPLVIPMLEKNLSKNKINYTLYKCALGEKSESAVLEYPAEGLNNIGGAKVIPGSVGAENCVQVNRLDDLLLSIEKKYPDLPISAIKIDVEGMESSVLSGALKTLGKHMPDLFLEVLNKGSMEDIESILNPLGYKKVVAFASSPVWHFVPISRYREKKTKALWYKVRAKSIRILRRGLRAFGSKS